MNLRMIRWYFIPFTGYKCIRRFIGGRWELWSTESMNRIWLPVTEPSVYGKQPSEECIKILHVEVYIKGDSRCLEY